jgi:hypothetical protein
VTAEMVANANYIELEKPESTIRTPAQVLFIDYEANLALLKADQADFLKNTHPLTLISDAQSGDDVEIWQLEDNDALAKTTGKINTVEVGSYPEGLGRFLVYRLSLSLQYRESASTLPVMKDGRLAGLLFRYDSRNQNAAVIPAPVIDHFLRDAADGAYQGFPRVGMGYSILRDAQFVSYLQLPQSGQGIYINKVIKESPADLAGIKEGDVLLSINQQTIDQDGNYVDPLHGKISLEHLIACQHFVGDELEIKLWRAGQEKTLQLTLARKNAEDFISPPYSYDQAPPYLVYGGFVFVELSRTLLKTFGSDWVSTAPQKLVYEDAFQDEIYPGEKRRIILISQVLPTDGTTSYEGLSGNILTHVNEIEIKQLSDINLGLINRKSGMDQLKLKNDPRTIYLDPLVVTEETPQLQKAYSITELERLK